MKKHIASIAIGAFVGVLLAFAFLFVRVRIADGIAEFFSRERESVAIADLVKVSLASKTEQYKIASHKPTVPAEGKALLADLEGMTITMYEDGEQVGQYDIQSVGREGTAWQTPVGTFEMSYKQENHFSSIGHVWMPWSMHFFGNYFIHGWPYYPDGTPVARGYSGGCIRMETVDAEQVYKFVDGDTALIVVNPDEETGASDATAYDVDKAAPEISAYAYLVADIETGEVVAAKNQKSAAGRDFAPVMTAMLSLESLNQYSDVVLDGQPMTVGDVLYALLLNDNDDAAELLYDRRNHAQYLIDMDDRAASIGMSNTVYEDVYGNDEGTNSTLEDTFRLMQYANWYKPFLIKAMGKTEYEKDDVHFKSNHPLADMQEYVAGYADGDNANMITLVQSNVAQEGENKRTFVVIVEGSEDAGRATQDLIDWVGENVRVK